MTQECRYNVQMRNTKMHEEGSVELSLPSLTLQIRFAKAFTELLR